MFLKNKRAHELIWQNPKNWINSEPQTLEKLSGKVILLDFWTYSCVNCIRTLPALKEIWKKYKNKRLVIIGIHTPEFDFEKELGNVKYAVKKHGLEYPILSDPERINWHNYGNTYWPRAALINSMGEIIFDHVGESGYNEIEEKIIEELKRVKEIKESDKIKIDEEKRQYDYAISHEIYAGSLRNGGFGSGKVCSKESCDEYFDNENYKKDVINPHSDWMQEKEFLEYKGKEGRGWIANRYYASEVNAVLSGNGRAEILLDERPLTKKNAGLDIEFKDGKSFVKIEGADMYNLVKTDGFKEGVLKILPFGNMRVYAYTFG